jgi:hypothetical protein
MTSHPMSFHSVAFGVYISEVLDIEDLFKLVAKDYCVVKESDSSSESGSGTDHEEELEESKEFNEDTFWNITLHDDIICEKGKQFVIRAEDFCNMQYEYVKNNNIKIGFAPCDAFMIYVGASSTQQLISCNFDQRTLLDLLDWEEKLVKESRLISRGTRLIARRNPINDIDE